MRPSIGLSLGERYHLTRQIAVGGMGEVWVADDGYLGRDVAVKVLREEFTGNEDFLRRLRTEARNSAALSHPNIAQMYDYGEQDGAGYLVMELVLGEPLADLLEREPVVAPRKLLPILAATARGLHHAHRAKVVHRDVKPGNILLEHDSRNVKITDFGVSLAANQATMTATGMVMGTAQYLSPEQAVGQPATAASDLYALGIVAYEATAGKRPFTGSTPVDIAVAHVNSAVPPLPSSVHPGLDDVIMRMLAKDPNKRPASGAALADELDVLAREIAEDPLGARSRAARRAARTGRPAPVRHARPDDAPPARPLDPAAHAERPAAAPSSSTPDLPEPVVPRSYPARRDLRSSAPARPTPPRGGPPSRAATRSDPTRTPASRASNRSSARPERSSTTTGQRLGGPLGRLSWPLLALLGLLGVLLLATLMSGLFGGDDGDAAALPLLAGVVLATRPASLRAMTDPGSGMMLPDPSHPAGATTTQKDV
ncbi:serine/threonine-protein kinase [Isoptericola sp. CG 20/1183]|uniref:non-specific serine/threonine protein kinase n=1 Tax=Isoptericola halotolerans TaxID=300560 RepID=A0ABX5EJT2_9MICO|nr:MULTISPECIES: serine/threonine-protein kinase [Isoptericola]MCK0116045.1 serine/threonine protein kinase [Isoptericola sp. S6320L]PRZ08776.1 serine/threonine-protein kinase [Isoptericola halotolerans]PRZ10777.1 serine/threonine-protein kinase [Isoptericola sp. CG 20/1183]